MQKLNITFLSCILMTSTVSFNQTGPGGLGNSTTNTYWLDAHPIDGLNGTSISSWNNYSGNNNYGTQGFSFVFYADSGSLKRFTVIFSYELDAEYNETTTETVETELGVEIVQIGNIVNVTAKENMEDVEITIYNVLGQQQVYFNELSLPQNVNLINIPKKLKALEY